MGGGGKAVRRTEVLLLLPAVDVRPLPGRVRELVVGGDLGIEGISNLVGTAVWEQTLSGENVFGEGARRP